MPPTKRFVVRRTEWEIGSASPAVGSVWPKIFLYEQTASHFLVVMRGEYERKGWKEHSQEVTGNIIKSVLHRGRDGRCVLGVESWECIEELTHYPHQLSVHQPDNG